MKKKPLHLRYSGLEATTTKEFLLIPTFDFMQELLSHGDYVEVIQPSSLRNKMRCLTQSLSDMYGGPQKAADASS